MILYYLREKEGMVFSAHGMWRLSRYVLNSVESGAQKRDDTVYAPEPIG